MKLLSLKGAGGKMFFSCQALQSWIFELSYILPWTSFGASAQLLWCMESCNWQWKLHIFNCLLRDGWEQCNYINSTLLTVDTAAPFVEEVNPLFGGQKYLWKSERSSLRVEAALKPDVHRLFEREWPCMWAASPFLGSGIPSTLCIQPDSLNLHSHRSHHFQLLTL